MAKIIKLNESDLTRIVRRAINEMDDEGMKIGDPVENLVSICDELSSAYSELQDMKNSSGGSKEDYKRLNSKVSKLIFKIEDLLMHGKSAHRKLSDELNDYYHAYKREEFN